MELSQPLSPNDHLGLHYFPDLSHYRARDLEIWLPELSRLGMRWLTLLAPAERAIPEYFLNGLLEGGVQPVLHFQAAPYFSTSTSGYRLLFKNYARWGVRYVALYDRPNCRANWSPPAWAQADLVERFLDLFIPLAETALDEGLTPIFPPLEPGGDYWDLSFLQSALRGILRRGRSPLLDKMALGLYAWTKRRSLEWGVGGPERWPGVAPYLTPPDSEDQLGFRIFDWYLAISQHELGKRLPAFLLRAGSLPEDHLDSLTGKPNYTAHAEVNLDIARLMAGEASPTSDPVPSEVVCCNFWLLSAQEKSALAAQAWFGTEAEKLPVVNAFYRFSARQNETPTGINPPTASPEIALQNPAEAHPVMENEAELVCDLVSVEAAESGSNQSSQADRPVVALTDHQSHAIGHYILLPLYAWGAADWDLETIQPLIQESHPTVGFSLTEARMAARVTVVGGDGAISAEALDMLRACGCKVERVLDDGTLVAS